MIAFYNYQILFYFLSNESSLEREPPEKKSKTEETKQNSKASQKETVKPKHDAKDSKVARPVQAATVTKPEKKVEKKHQPVKSKFN